MKTKIELFLKFIFPTLLFSNNIFAVSARDIKGPSQHYASRVEVLVKKSDIKCLNSSRELEMEFKKDNLTWTNVTDFKGNKNKAAIIYGVSYYPTNFLIDRAGTIIARDLTGEKLREKLKEVLN